MRILLSLISCLSLVVPSVSRAEIGNKQYNRLIFHIATHSGWTFEEFTSKAFDTKFTAAAKNFLHDQGADIEDLGKMEFEENQPHELGSKTIVFTSDGLVKVNGEILKYDKTKTPIENYKAFYFKMTGKKTALSLLLDEARAEEQLKLPLGEPKQPVDPRQGDLFEKSQQAPAGEPKPGTAPKAAAQIPETKPSSLAPEIKSATASSATAKVGFVKRAGRLAALAAGLYGGAWAVSELLENSRDAEIGCDGKLYRFRFKTRTDVGIASHTYKNLSASEVNALLGQYSMTRVSSCNLIDITILKNDYPKFVDVVIRDVKSRAPLYQSQELHKQPNGPAPVILDKTQIKQ